MTYNQIVLQRTFTKKFKVLKKKKKSWLVHSTFQSWFKFLRSPVPPIEEVSFFVFNVFFFFYFALLVNEVGMCVNDRVPYLA